MDNKKFKVYNRLAAIAVLLISATTYLLTIEETASYWDCGEFTASSYKLEVGHPPGNPFFQLVARVFTMFGDNMHAAVLVNAMSALCSAFTIFFLYLTIVFFAKRFFLKGGKGNKDIPGELSASATHCMRTGDAIAIIGSGIVGSLIYCFSDTFWFSAVESEVYAMSSMFTAIVFWAMTKWYEQADEPGSARWIVLISLLMGLSIGVHLLNLLVIPAIVFLYYYKRREDGHYTFKEYILITILSVVILGLLVFGIIPYLPKIASYFDLFFVNVLGCPFNTGAVVFMLLLLGTCFYYLFKTQKEGKSFWNTVLLCFTVIVIGFSVFSIDIIRSSAKTPTNEYQPDNPFTLVRYLGREQYGSNPLVYGQYFDCPYELENGKYWAPLGDKYRSVNAPVSPVYKKSGKMLFPRMWSSDDRHIEFYKSYMGNRGHKVPGAIYNRPTFADNIKFFIDYQLNWMYWRYFMWNFVGRQNDIHSPTPGNIFYGNWESGIKPIDQIRLMNQEDAPAPLKDNKGKNHYYFLPLLLGLLGLFFQYDRDKRGCWVVFLLFFMTGIAIVLYLNQPPFQVRERDYAYAGSFYAFSIWTGFAVAAIYAWVREMLVGKAASDGKKVIATEEKTEVASAVIVTIACLFVPALMAAENWDDHDRSNRFTSIEMATNYLNSVGKNGILITHGDNDTFPLWYAQEVEDVRTDVRICNTSLLGTDWHIDQMKYAVNESAPLDLTIGLDQYLYGTNEFIFIDEHTDKPVPIKDVIKNFKDPGEKVRLTSGNSVDYIMARKIIVPVNKKNVIKYGILGSEYESMIPESIILEIPKEKNFISKPELFILDFLANYKWDRPLNMLNMGGDINIGIKDYLMYMGYSYKFVPIKTKSNSMDVGFVDVEQLHNLISNVYSWDALKRTDYFVDYQNLYTHLGVMSQRGLFAKSAKVFMMTGHSDWARETLQKCIESVPNSQYPLETIPLGFAANDYMVVDIIDMLYKLGNREEARRLVDEFSDELFTSLKFYLQFYEYAEQDSKLCFNILFYLEDVAKRNADSEKGEQIYKRVEEITAPYMSSSAK